MSFSRITAIVRPERVEHIESELRKAGIPGITVSQVKGYGSYADFYRNDWMISHVQLDLVVHEDEAEKLAGIIMNAAHTGSNGDGLVTLSPISHVYHIRTRSECTEKPC